MRHLACLLVILAGCGRPAETVTPKPPAAPERTAARLPPVEMEARESRQSQLRHDADAIRSECERAAGGDWRKWQAETARYRDALTARIAKLKFNNLLECEFLAALDRPYFQDTVRMSLGPAVDPTRWDDFRKTRAVVAGSRWLRGRGVDLVFVTVPTMPEVYIEHFLAETPPDGVIAPHRRRTFLDLLEADVEVVNTFRLMRDARDRVFQYLPADHHWNQPGMLATARDVADRFSRYQFGKDAKKAAPVTKSRPGPYVPPSAEQRKAASVPGGGTLTEEQWQSALGTQPATIDYITSPDGSPLADDPRSPVLLIGNSYVVGFREVLIREANLRVRTNWGNGQSTQAFAGFLREPETLDGVKVVVWVNADQFLAHFSAMPEPVTATLQDGE